MSRYRSALLLGAAAAVASIVAALLIRTLPSSTSLLTTGHFVVNLALFTWAGARVAPRGGAGWRAGLIAGGMDALVGHPIAFLLSDPPREQIMAMASSSASSLTPDQTDALVTSMHRTGALVGALSAMVIAAIAASVGAWLSRREASAR
jgi:hypothetical protein